MLSSLYLIFLLCLGCIAVWPAPLKFESGHSVLWISQDFDISYTSGSVCTKVPSILSPTEHEFILQAAGQPDTTSTSIIQAALSRAKVALFEKNIVPWKLVARNKLVDFEPSQSLSKTYIKKLDIVQTKLDNGSISKSVAGQVDESYNLTISADGKARITATSSVGVLHALETFVQLFYQHSSKSGVYTNLAPVAIVDAPKFPHRGLNLDVSRNWYPVDNILRTIDALSWNKFNRLHIHMTDSQSWPLEIPAIPELAREGAYQKGLSYSPSDFEKIQKYGIERGVQVYIEFDMPGHTTAIALSHPELITAANAKPWTTYCLEPPCGSLKLNSSAVDKFLNTLFDDVLPRTKPYSSYFHTGGDEVNLNSYLLEEDVKSNDFKVIKPLMQKLVDRNHAQIRKYGLTPVVWEEIALDWNLTLGKDIIVQTWLSSASAAQVTAKGHKALVGSYDFWYLDCGAGQWLNIENGASFKQHYPFNDYCSPVKNWRLAYSFDPLAGIAKSEAHLVLGGECHIWSEQTDPVNLDDMVWPRASAVGEVLWSGRQDSSGQNRSQITAAPRLAEMRERMVARGIRAGPVQMVFCTQNDAHECSL